jgi:hypothetical protein
VFNSDKDVIDVNCPVVISFTTHSLAGVAESVVSHPKIITCATLTRYEALKL